MIPTGLVSITINEQCKTVEFRTAISQTGGYEVYRLALNLPKYQTG